MNLLGLGVRQVEELTHFAELLIARPEQVPGGLVYQRHELPVQDVIKEPRCGLVIRVRPAIRLGDDFVNNAQLF